MCSFHTFHKTLAQEVQIYQQGKTEACSLHCPQDYPSAYHQLCEHLLDSWTQGIWDNLKKLNFLINTPNSAFKPAAINKFDYVLDNYLATHQIHG